MDIVITENSQYEYISKKEKLAGKDIWIIKKRVKVADRGDGEDAENNNPWVRVGGTRYYSTPGDAKVELDTLRGKNKKVSSDKPEMARSEAYEHAESDDLESDVDPSQISLGICESLVNCAIQEKTAEFKQVFENEVTRRINDKIEEMRAEVAKKITSQEVDSKAA